MKYLHFPQSIFNDSMIQRITLIIYVKYINDMFTDNAGLET